MPPDSARIRRTLAVDGQHYAYWSLPAARDAGLVDGAALDRLPWSLRIVFENLLRQWGNGQDEGDLATFTHWLRTPRTDDCEVGFRPTRVMMPESSGLPLLGDLAAMRDAMVALGGDAAAVRRINPQVPVDVIVDHSVMVHESGHANALLRNMTIEFEQNSERFGFLRWASQAFANLRVFPPGSGICHQINLEHIARVVWSTEQDGTRWAFPDSLIALDSHTAMINALGVFGWGVGGLEGGAAVLGEPVAVLIPKTTGCQLTGRLRPGVTATDLVLTLTELQRKKGVVGQFVEYHGPGVDTLSLQDRATVSNMTPECGATMCFFAVDAETLRYLRVTGRDAHQVALVEAYAKAQGLWRDASTPVPEYDQWIELDLGSVAPCMAGPGRPDKRVPLAATRGALEAATGPLKGPVPVAGADFTLKSGDVVIAAITSCTNTSNPAVMVGAGLVARNARRRGLVPKPWVKTSLSPGSRVVAAYLEQSGLQDDLDALGFQVTGFGCMTCIGHSGPLPANMVEAIEKSDLACVAVVSANRNFDARTHPNARANFLASPPLVVAAALAGSVAIDLESDPLGHDANGQPVYLREIWPDDAEIRAIVEAQLTPQLVRERYRDIERGTPAWQALSSGAGTLYPWDANSHFLLCPPFFDGMTRAVTSPTDIHGARLLGMFGDMTTTDHISPTGDIGRDTPAGRYLQSLGVAPRDFVSYSARRQNHHVMTRGTFANVRIKNEIVSGTEGSATVHFPSGVRMDIYEAAQRYRAEGVPLVVVAGQEYGAGSSRDWASKGTDLLGVKAVLAESFERIHRSNLVTMGVLPLQFPPNMTRQTLGLTGNETFELEGIATLAKGGSVRCTIGRADGSRTTLDLRARIDSQAELEYYRHGGIIKYVLRRKLDEAGAAAK